MSSSVEFGVVVEQGLEDLAGQIRFWQRMISGIERPSLVRRSAQARLRGSARALADSVRSASSITRG